MQHEFTFYSLKKEKIYAYKEISILEGQFRFKR